jgi:exopolysaccharide biosynthesis polyprenyl glycosylphosphotransferase
LDSRAKTALRTLVLCLDAVLVVAAMGLAVLLHSLLRDLVPALRAIPSLQSVTRLAILVLPLWVALISLFGLDRVHERVWTRRQLVAGLAKLHAVGLVALTVILFLTQIVINRSLILAFLASSFALLYLQRALLARWRRYQIHQGQVPNRLLLVGDPTRDLVEFVRALADQPLPPILVGRMSPIRDHIEGLPRRLGDVDELERVLREDTVDAVVFFPPFQSHTRAAEQLEVCETAGVPAHFALDLGRPNQAEPRILTLYDHPFVTYEVAPKNAARVALKHGFDVLAAAAAIVLLAPILLATAAAIVATMGRPVLFIQDRAGLRGRRFRMYKFRTMFRDADAQRERLADKNEAGGPVFKVRKDPRVTRLGWFLRRSSIDELPQLFNVLTGSMSLVGPRPLPVKEQEQIKGWHRRRLMMKPGLTCLWQVSGRSDIDFEEWMKLDLRYVDEWSLVLDLKIMLRTIPAVLSARGAH